MGQSKITVVAGVALLGVACGSGSSTDNTLAVAWVSYTDDGTLVVASRERVVRLDPTLKEIDRTVPPFPFDPKVQPGLEYFGVSRDGSVASIGWQNNTNAPAEPTLTAGGTCSTSGRPGFSAATPIPPRPQPSRACSWRRVEK